MAIVVERVTATIDSPSAGGTGAFSGTPTAGNRIVITTWNYGTSGSTHTGSDDATGGSNTYTTRAIVASGTSNNCAISDTTIVNTKSGLAVTTTWDSGGVTAGGAMEISGLSASPIDITTTVNDGSDPYTLATGTLAQADEIIVAALCFMATTLADHGVTTNAWSGSTPVENFLVDGGSIAGEYGITGHLIVSSTSSITTSFSGDTATTGGLIALVTYKMAAASGSVPRMGLLGVG